MKKALVLSTSSLVAQWRDYGADPDAFPPAGAGTFEADLPDDFAFPEGPRWYVGGRLVEAAPQDRRALVDAATGAVLQWRDYMSFGYPELAPGLEEVPLPADFEVPDAPTWYAGGQFTQEAPPAPAEPPAPPMTEAGAKAQRDALLAEATLRIDPLQDAVDLEEATDAEAALLKKWKKYRVDLSRIELQPGFPAGVQWPARPE